MNNYFKFCTSKGFYPFIPMLFNSKNCRFINWKNEVNQIKNFEEAEKVGNSFTNIKPDGTQKTYTSITGSALLTGAVSGIMVVDLDIDPKKDKNGVKEYSKLLKEIEQDIVETLTCKSVTGGVHLYFNYKEGLTNISDVLPGIDIRTDGGLIICPGTYRNEHRDPKDKKGEWVKGYYEIFKDLPVVDMPDKLFNKLKELCNKSNSTNKQSRPSEANAAANASEVMNSQSISNKNNWYTVTNEGGRDEKLYKYLCSMVNIPHFRTRETLLAQATMYNNSFLNPPLTIEEVEAKVDSALKHVATTYEGKLNSAITNDKNGGKKVDQLSIGRYIIEEYRFLNNDQYFYKYNPEVGTWNRINKSTLQALITKDLSRHCNYWSDTCTRGITNFVFNETYNPEPSSLFHEEFNLEPYKVTFKNGVLDFKTLEFTKSFDPDLKATVAIPHNYDGEASIPIKTIEFLSLMTTNENEIQFIFEWIGYLFVARYDIQKILFLSGDGGNGKSTLINLMTACVGASNTSTVSLRSLVNNRFSGSLLYNKLFNTVADIGSDFFDESDMLKTLTGDDTVTVERKNENGFSYLNFAKMTYSANKLPKFKDTTEGLNRRPIVLPLKLDFTTRVKAKGIHIKDIINDEKEMERVISYSVKAFYDVIKRGKVFTESEAMLKAKTDWLGDNPLVDFIQERFEVTGSTLDTCLFDDFYGSYKCYCLDNGYKPLSKARATEFIKSNEFFTNNKIIMKKMGSNGHRFKITGIKKY